MERGVWVSEGEVWLIWLTCLILAGGVKVVTDIAKCDEWENK